MLSQFQVQTSTLVQSHDRVSLALNQHFTQLERTILALLHSVSDIKANNRQLLHCEGAIGAEIHSSLHESFAGSLEYQR